LEYKNV